MERRGRRNTPGLVQMHRNMFTKNITANTPCIAAAIHRSVLEAPSAGSPIAEGSGLACGMTACARDSSEFVSLFKGWGQAVEGLHTVHYAKADSDDCHRYKEDCGWPARPSTA